MIHETALGRYAARVAFPEGHERAPAVVIAPDAGGIDTFLLDMVELYAEEGYVAATVDFASCDAPLDALGSVVDLVRRMPRCDSRIGVLGFGDGSLLAWNAARRCDLDAAVGYGGQGFPADSEPRCPIALQLPGDAAAREFKSRVSANPRIAVHVYEGAAAGFERASSPNHVKVLAEIAHDRAIGQFRRAMGPHYDLGALWEYHRSCEFDARDTAMTMATMVASPYVNHIPTMTGGVGFAQLARFYKYHFIPKNSAQRDGILISRTIGATQIVEELVARFVHDREMDWMLPGIAPTGKKVEIPLVVIVKFRGPKLYHEHIYWDQASVLAQLGLLDPRGLPVVGRQQAHKLIDESLPSNTLLANWGESENKPVP